MINLIKIFSGLILGIALAGCALSKDIIITKSQSERSDIFEEIQEPGPPPNGWADLKIKASIKTHLENYYFSESKGSPHGKPEYPFLVNIDGQAALWNVKGRTEVTPECDENRKRNPEGGEGMRYVLSKKVRLASGLHKLFFGLPGEDYFTELNIKLLEGEVNSFEFQPGYRSRRGRETQSFLHGVKKGQVFLNGNLIQ